MLYSVLIKMNGLKLCKRVESRQEHQQMLRRLCFFWPEQLDFDFWVEKLCQIRKKKFVLSTRKFGESAIYVAVGFLNHCQNYISVDTVSIWGVDFAFRMKSILITVPIAWRICLQQRPDWRKIVVLIVSTVHLVDILCEYIFFSRIF